MASNPNNSNYLLLKRYAYSRLTKAPQDMHILVLGTCVWQTLYAQRGFAHVIKLKLLQWRDYSGLPAWALNVITVSL